MTHLNDITTDTNVSTRSKGSHLTIDDRVKISVLKELEYSNRMIAQYIGVAHGTIDREIKRGMVTKMSKQSNNGKVYCYYKEYYDPYTAQERYEKSRSNCAEHQFINHLLKSLICLMILCWANLTLRIMTSLNH